MPRPALPPTPQASTDIQAKQPDPNAAHDPSWTLPPAALARDRGSVSSSSVASCNASDSSYHPSSPVPVVGQAAQSASRTSPSAARKRASNGAVVTKHDYSLPPPPTRLRKIIQMKPKPEPEEHAPAGNATATANAKAGGKGAAGAAGAPASGKKKQASGSTPAGRKIARKTAHSLIERRRRSKMNEEFGVLKDMIPACAGQEMHKLAILQASIEYMRYLERCVAELKESHRSRQQSVAEPPRSATLSSAFQAPPTTQQTAAADDAAASSSEDEEMSDALSPTTTTPNPIQSHSHSHSIQSTHSVHSAHSTHPTPSPALYPLDRHHNMSAATSPAMYPADHHRRLSSITPSPNLYALSRTNTAGTTATSATTPFSTAHTISPSILPSPSVSVSGSGIPVFGGESARERERQHSLSFAPLTSPALRPVDCREDREATQALLMLNCDRRAWTGQGQGQGSAGSAGMGGGRGMSVRDLLSG